MLTAHPLGFTWTLTRVGLRLLCVCVVVLLSTGSIGEAQEIRLLQKKPDPHGYPRPAPGEKNVPAATSFFLQLGFDKKDVNDTVVSDSIAVRIGPRGEPAVDILQSISRLAVAVTGPRIKEAAGRVKRWLATYREAEDLINVGAYVEGSNPEIDQAVAKMPAINDFLVQGIEERSAGAETLRRLGEIAEVPIPEEELSGEAISIRPRAAAAAEVV